MPVTFACPCGVRLQAAGDLRGRHFQCPACGTVLAIPGPSPARPLPGRRFLGSCVAGVAAFAVTAVLLTAVSVVLLFRSWAAPGPLNALRQEPISPASATTRPEEPPAEVVAAGPREAAAPRPPANSEADALERLNGYRTLAGLPKVTIDPALSRGCLDHARYLARNFEQLRKRGLPTNDESPELPGFSEAGKAAAKAAFGGYNRRAAGDLMDGWLGTAFIRPMLLDPELRRAGWGAAPASGGGWFAVLDVSRGRGTDEIVIYPADGQKHVPIAYPGAEIPDPIPQAKQKRAGYPITVMFPPSATVRDVTVHLTRGGEDVPVWVSTPEKPAQDALRQRNTVCIIARQPLDENTAYAVTVEARVDDKPWSYKGGFTTGREPAAPEETPADREAVARAVLAQVNGYRKQVNLAPVVLDAGLSRGCQAHAEYLVRNTGHPSTEGIGAHEEDPKLPGYTAEGRRAGRAGDIALAVEPLRATAEWMATLFHRVPLLEPDLRRVGFGVAHSDQAGWVSVLDIHSGRGSDRPVFYPVDGQKDVPLGYDSGERPDPIPESKDKKAGFPVSVAFPRGLTVQDARARLTDASGQEVPAWVLTPEKTVDAELQRNSVCLIARQPLRPGTRYTATVTARVDGTEWQQTWSFTTRPRP